MSLIIVAFSVCISKKPSLEALFVTITVFYSLSKI